MNRYPKYKDSGFEWVGEIPSHWGAVRAKFQLSRNDGGVWGSDLDDSDGGTVVIRSTEITIDGKWELSNPAVRLIPETVFKKYRLIEGDILVTKSSGSPAHIGKSCVVDQRVENLKCCYSNFVQRIRFASNSPKLYHYVLNSHFVREQYKFLTHSTTGLGNLDSTAINDVVLPIIPRESQPKVLQYLDKKTSQIDSLIEKLERKIEILREYRVALISRCVTKGLRPDAEVNESGIEWIGKIPKHWRRVRIKFVSTFQLSSVDRHVHAEELPVFICHYPNVYYSEKICSQTKLPVGTCSEIEYDRFRVKSGDILITKDSESADDIGVPCMITEDLKNTVCGYHLGRYRFSSGVDPEFGLRYFQSVYARIFFQNHSKGITRYALGSDVLRNLVILLPPYIEQLEITRYLDKKTAQIDSLIEKLTQKIALQKEYRQCLISNVVTGKVRVTECDE